MLSSVLDGMSGALLSHPIYVIFCDRTKYLFNGSSSMSHIMGGNLESIGMTKCPSPALTHAGFSRLEEGTRWGMILLTLPQVYVHTHTHTHNFINIFMNILL